MRRACDDSGSAGISTQFSSGMAMCASMGHGARRFLTAVAAATERITWRDGMGRHTRQGYCEARSRSWANLLPTGAKVRHLAGISDSVERRPRGRLHLRDSRCALPQNVTAAAGVFTQPECDPATRSRVWPVRGDNALFEGRIERPVMTWHGTGDLSVRCHSKQIVDDDAVDGAGQSALLVQRLMRIPGHCGFGGLRTTRVRRLTSYGGVRDGTRPDGDRCRLEI